jgi:hypothetical protein
MMNLYSEVGLEHVLKVQQSQRHKYVLGVLPHEAGIAMARLSLVQ